MSIIWVRYHKTDIITVAEEFRIKIEPNYTRTELGSVILESVPEGSKGIVKQMLESLLAERKEAKESEEKARLEREKVEREYQFRLEVLKLQNERMRLENEAHARRQNMFTDNGNSNGNNKTESRLEDASKTIKLLTVKVSAENEGGIFKGIRKDCKNISLRSDKEIKEREENDERGFFEERVVNLRGVMGNIVTGETEEKSENAEDRISDQDRFRKEQETCQSLVESWQNAAKGKGNYYIGNNSLFHKDEVLGENVGHLVVPQIRTEGLLKLAHCCGGYMGTKKTLKRKRYSFLGKNMKSDVRKFCEASDECQLTRKAKVGDRTPKSSKLLGWAIAWKRWNNTITHRPGVQHKVADAFSRLTTG